MKASVDRGADPAYAKPGEIDTPTSSSSMTESKDIDMEDPSEVKSDDGCWDSENGDDTTEKNNQPASLKSVTSSNQQVVSTETPETNLNLKIESVSLGSTVSHKERASSPMASSDRRGTPPSVSFAELPKVIASGSYLAAALKASVVSSCSSTVFSPSDSPFKQGSFSPPDSPSSASSKGTTRQPIPPLSKSSSLGDIANSASAVASSLLKSSPDSTSNHLTSMIQGIPLLSSVLPALQRLAPGSFSSLTSVPSGTGGIICVCGVKFTSTSNLEAHRLFYCSHRQVNSDGRSERKEGSPSRDADDEATSPSGRLLKCPHCAYTTTHKLSLNGHMNIHTNPEDSSSQSSKVSPFPTAVDPRAQERYCSDCDIQFSSIKTYRVHKAHYCQTRHVLKGSKSPAREETPHVPLSGLGSSGPPAGAQPVLALPTNPVLLLPYSMVAGAQLLPPHVLPQLGAAFVLPNGQVHPIPSASASASHSSTSGASIPPLLSPGALAAATAAIISASSNVGSSTVSLSLAKGSNTLATSSSRSKSPRGEEETASGGKRRGDGECPLDLTTKRPKLAIKTDLLNDEEKENRETINSVDSKSTLFKFGGGEFEGKLLNSPPTRVSPSIDGNETDTSTPSKSPVPPSLTSPKGHSESPRPSTSALSTSSSRSPGHTSPIASAATTQGLPHLPSGFPSPLVNSLESLASLQCLQSLQNVPRELALKLINPELLINGLPPVLNPPVIVKQGEAKCNECNIVFYKEESLQIHKKHYCSARESTTAVSGSKTSDEECNRSPPQSSSDGASGGGSSGSSSTTTEALLSPGRDAPSSSSSSGHLSAAKDAPKQSKPLLQFICTACGIKFSSPDNLNAHQTYYCPKREGAAEEGAAKGVWRCPRCRVVMVETMQAAHQCVSPSPAPSHGWKCPCCPVLSPTAAAAQKHLETHAGIKAFRCTICGYRGNTLRGMRTHIRMHFEKRTNDLQEENFIACILEDEDQRGRANSSAEARKMIDSTRMILENTALSALLGEGGALSEQVDPPLSCAYCPFITPMRTTLLQHLTIVHKIGLESSLSQELKNLFGAKLSAVEASVTNASSSKRDAKPESENGARETSPPISSIKLEPEVKLEIQEPEEEPQPQPRSSAEDEPRSPSSLLPNGSSPNGQCYCQTCNISFSLLDSYVAHKRFYCTRPESSTPPETTVQ